MFTTITSGRNYKIKEEKDICILAHAYQSHNILEVADLCW